MLLAICFTILQNSWIQTHIAHYVAENLSKSLHSEISIEKVEIGLLKKIRLNNVLIKDQQGDTLVFSKSIKAKIDSLQLKRNNISIRNICFTQNRIYIKKDTADKFNFSFITDKFGINKEKDTLNTWDLSCKSFDFNDVNFHYTDLWSGKKQVEINGLNLSVSDLQAMGDSAYFKLNELSIYDGHGFSLKHSDAEVFVQNNLLRIKNCNMKSTGSSMNNTDMEFKFYTETDSTKRPFDLKINIGKSKISLNELSLFVPKIKGMNQKIWLSGLIYGSINDLKGKNIKLHTGYETNAQLDFYINDLLKTKNMYLFVDLKKIETSIYDIGKIRLPYGAKSTYIKFPENLYETGLLKFKGNFSGFLSDFVTFGTLESSMGTLTTDILVTPEKDGNIFYSGKIETTDFMLGKLFRDKKLGEITFNGKADGRYNPQNDKISGLFKGNIAHIDYKSYNYKNITIDGKLSDKMFDGLLEIKDPNLNFSFLGEMDLKKDVPVFDFNLNIKKAKPGKLNLGDKFVGTNIALKMKAKFTGDKIDNFNGDISVTEGYYSNPNGMLKLQGTTFKASDKLLKITSDYLDATITGDYHFNKIKDEFTRIAGHYVESLKKMPQSHKKTKENGKLNNFDYSINVKNINPLVNILMPGFTFETPFLLYGKINTYDNYFSLKGSIPGIKYKDYWGKNIYIGNHTDDNKFDSKFKIGELYGRNGLKLFNLTVGSELTDNILNNTISWGNYERITYSGSIKTQTTFLRNKTTGGLKIAVKGIPSKVYIADTAWSIEPFSFSIDSSNVAIDSFNMHHNQQLIAVKGKITDKKTDQLNLKVKNIDLSYFKKYIKRDIALAGIINGDIAFSKVDKKPILLSDLSIDSLFYKNEYMGNIFLQTQWNDGKSEIDAKLKVARNNRLNLNASGTYTPSSGALDFNAKADSISLLTMEAFMGANFSNFEGTGSGSIHIGGTVNNVLLNGALYGNNAGLTIDATQVPYSFSDSVYFGGNTIEFDHITIHDEENNTGIFNGKLTHQNFKHMTYDLTVSSKKIKALNTTKKDNSLFYGTAVADAKLQITGNGQNVELNCTAKSLKGTDIKISMENENNIDQYDFLEFAKEEKPDQTPFAPEEQKKTTESGGFKLNMNVEATPEAKVQLIYNSQIGDAIKAQGEGFLQFSYDYLGNMSLSGNFDPVSGDYLFTLQNIMNKRFSIAPGGSMIWSGDPYNAIIDLKAIYSLRASLYDLLVNSYEDISQSSRITVECIIKLKNELMNPTIGFDVNFPDAEDRVKDELQQFFNTEEEMNKQILSLIVMGKFYTPEYMRGSYEAQNTSVLGSTVSEMLSNQLSNWFSQINEDWNVGINYRPSTQDNSNDEVELALSTQFFNDRVTINGNISNNTNQYSTNNNSSQIVGDFEMNVKLIPNGKILFKAYHRSNNNLIYETDPYTQGIGLSFREEFNTFDELLKKFGRIFKKKKASPNKQKQNKTDK